MIVNIGKAFKRFRYQAAISQRELGQLMGVTNATISKIETGLHSPRIETLRRMTEGNKIEINVYITNGVVDAYVEEKRL